MDHFDFRLRNNILFAIDYKSISIIKKGTSECLTIYYPEAAVWAILIEHHSKIQTISMLMAVLGESKTETSKFLRKCIKRWKEKEIIE
jgi:hypothetical protein